MQGGRKVQARRGTGAAAARQACGLSQFMACMPCRQLRKPLPSPVHASLPCRRSRHAGLSNTAGALPGVLGVTFAGYLLDQTGSWASALFFPTAACQLFGLVIYTIFASSKRQGWD